MKTKTELAHYFSETFIGADTAPATREEAHALAQHWADQGDADERDAHEMADAWCDVHGVADEGDDDGDELTAEYGDAESGWLVVDTSNQRFWPAPAANSAREALAAAHAGRGTWHQ